ncbi:MAG: hypothetical protein J5I81_11060 [Nitrococcus mobilis]|nr:hypothetical protein [Nitrococcus mobilis]
MFRFLVGIIIVQGATAVLVLAALQTPAVNWLLFALLALIASVLTALWFASIANHIKKDALARMKEASVRERERLLVSTEKEKNRIFQQTYQRFNKETSRAHAKANFKVGAAVVGAVGVGVGLLSLQFVTLGLLPLFAAAGGLAGYGVRARQEALARKGNSAKGFFARRRPIKSLGTETALPIVSPRKASR